MRIDAYAIVMNGALDQNVTLQPGDTLFVPVASRQVVVEGEVARPGKYEAVSFGGGICRVKDAIDLALGFTTAALPSKATLERKGADGSLISEPLNLERICSEPGSAANVELRDGDKIRVPSISEYQSVIRMVGEFTGQGVYQRAVGAEKEEVLNKSGVYRLADGETAGGVIRKTGGWTPQADLRNARIERRNGSEIQVLALDLERILVRNDKSADAVLQNGDTLVLPSLVDKVQVLGQVARPGAYPYTPGRRLIEYIGEAGGPGPQAKPRRVTVVRRLPQGSQIFKVSLGGQAGSPDANNPILEPGDVVYVPEAFLTNWRDIVQLLTAYRLLQTVF